MNRRLPLVWAPLALAAILAARLAAAQNLDPRQPFPPALGGTTVQLPTFGVAIDAEGVLSLKTFEDPTGQLNAVRLQAAKAQLAPDIQARSRLRKVSLVRLEKAIRQSLDKGAKPDAAMCSLAGLQRVQYVLLFPKTGDVVLAGPAEGFAPDLAGRVCGLGSGRPTLQLDDLIVALRAFAPGRPAKQFIGCTIDPVPEAMLRLQEFQKTVPHSVPEANREAVGQKIADGMRSALGLAPVRVFGLPANSHFSQVLVEADYRMKLIGIGLERPAIRLPSYFELVGAGGGAAAALQRWWFTPNYDCVKATDDRQAMELVGEGVQLLTESKLIDADGNLKSGAPTSRASETFTLGFTRKYPELAAKTPVYAELRNLVDLLVAAAFMQQQGFAEKAGWKMTTLLDERALPVQNQATPKQALCAVNAAWRANHLVAVAGGGVSIHPDEALAAERLIADKDGQLEKLRSEVAGKPPAIERWWWD